MMKISFLRNICKELVLIFHIRITRFQWTLTRYCQVSFHNKISKNYESSKPLNSKISSQMLALHWNQHLWNNCSVKSLVKTINPLHIPHSFQKQPSSGLLRKMSCENMITLWNGCSPVHLLHTSDAFQPLTIITKRSILNVAAVLDSPLVPASFNHYFPKPP